jgi:3-oxoacyl-[acyl-carrier protein] reductase/meso-butanediol dehydrogenase/(S,S)-butanediol dehydrogenase/diacetyl reductase
VTDLTFEAWARVITVNLTGTFLMSQAVARQMIAQGGGGSILNISSIASKIAGANSAAYSASKAGINAFGHALAMELARHQIRVNTICPGVVETARMDDLGRGERWQRVEQSIPLGFAGNGTECAYLAVYLCSDMANWITGQTINIDGGTTWH